MFGRKIQRKTIALSAAAEDTEVEIRSYDSGFYFVVEFWRTLLNAVSGNRRFTS